MNRKRKLVGLDFRALDDSDVPAAEFELRSRLAAEIYSKHLKLSGGLPAMASWLRVLVANDIPLVEITDEPISPNMGYLEVVRSPVDTAIRGAAPELRVELYLRFIDSFMKEMAPSRLWDVEQLDEIYKQSVLDSGVFKLHSKVFINKATRLRAQVELSVTPDGVYRGVIFCTDRSGRVVESIDTVTYSIWGDSAEDLMKELQQNAEWTSDDTFIAKMGNEWMVMVTTKE